MSKDPRRAKLRLRRLRRGGPLEETKFKQAENRRKLISKMDRESALLATREFAKLGLYQ